MSKHVLKSTIVMVIVMAIHDNNKIVVQHNLYFHLSTSSSTTGRKQ